MMNEVPIAAARQGVRPDLDLEDVPDLALADAENMMIRDGNLQSRPGFNTFATDINERPMGYVSVDHNDGTRKLVQGTTVGWRTLSAGTWTDITQGGNALTGGVTDQIVYRTFPKAGATWLLGTNGANTAKKWDGTSGNYVDVGGSPPRARCMGVVGDRVVLANLFSGGTISPVAIDVSAKTDFDTGWGTQLVALLAQTEGPIMSIVELGDLNAAILKTDAVHLIIAQGGVVPFRLQQVKTGISGPPAPLLATRLGEGAACFCGNDAVVSLFDGAAVTLLPYHVQKQIDRTFNPLRINRGWMTYDSNRRELWIVYPLKGSDEPNGGVIINMQTYEVYPIRFPTFKVSAGAKVRYAADLTIGELTVPIGALSQTIGNLVGTNSVPRVIIGDTGGQSYQDTGLTDGGAAIPFFWETPVRGVAERYRTVTSIRHRFKQTALTQAVMVKVGKRNEGHEIAYDPGQTIDISSLGKKTTGHRSSAEYLSLRYEGDATQLISYQGGLADIAPRGQR